jgi:hypothetical protein
VTFEEVGHSTDNSGSVNTARMETTINTNSSTCTCIQSLRATVLYSVYTHVSLLHCITEHAFSKVDLSLGHSHVILKTWEWPGDVNTPSYILLQFNLPISVQMFV